MLVRVSGGFVLAHPLRLEAASIALFGAALQPLIANPGSCMAGREANSKLMMELAVDPFVQKPQLSLKSGDLVIKALATMEQNDNSRILAVVHGQHRCVATILDLDREMALHDTGC